MSKPAVRFLDDDTQRCLRCKSVPAVLDVRKDGFCKDCFVRFLRGKQRKHMLLEKFKAQYHDREKAQRVLLAYGGGVSSLVLLDVVASLLQEQAHSHSKRQGFGLVVVYLADTCAEHADKVYRQLQHLSRSYSPVTIHTKMVPLDSFVMDGSEMHNISLDERFACLSHLSESTGTVTLASLLQKCPTLSAVEDFKTVVSDILVRRIAVDQKCLTIIYGHSMTRLANEVISLTVKGRGSSVHDMIANRQVHFQGKEIGIIFPLRDILHAEITAYARLQELDRYIVPLKVTQSAIKRNWTIRDLVTDYFRQLDNTGYSSTASTVIKTAEKLGEPSTRGTTKLCEVCGHVIYKDSQTWLKLITVSDAAPLNLEVERNSFKEYQLAVARESYDRSPDRELNNDNDDRVKDRALSICYGCIVNIGRTSSANRFVWPATPQNNGELGIDYVRDDCTTREILDEFILLEDE